MFDAPPTRRQPVGSVNLMCGRSERDHLPTSAALGGVDAMESAATMRLNFAHGSDATRSFTIAVDGDDDQHSQVFQSVCGFLWMYWPKDIARELS